MSAAKTTNLYLMINQKEGMKFSPVDPLTGRVNKKAIIIVFPTKPMPVDTMLAELLMEQNPHLLSTKVYDPENDVRVKTVREADATRAELLAKSTETTEERERANERFIRASSNPKVRQFLKVRPNYEPEIPEVEEGVSEPEEDVMKYVESLSEFAEIDRVTVTRAQLRKLAKSLDIPLGKKSKVADILKFMDKHAAKMTQKIDAVMNGKAGVPKENNEIREIAPMPNGLPEADELIEEVDHEREAQTVEALTE